MWKKTATSLAIVAMLAAAGCATVPPGDPLMVDARTSVSAAQSNPQVVTYAPLELAQAVDTLRQANDLAARNGGVVELHQLATLASQRAALAQQVARTRADEVAIMAQRKAHRGATVCRLEPAPGGVSPKGSRRAGVRPKTRSALLLRCAPNTYPPTAYDYRRRENERLYEAR